VWQPHATMVPMSPELSAAIVGGLISGGVVLLGVIFAEVLRRQRENRQRRFRLLLTGRSVMDEFAAAVEGSKEGGASGRATVFTQRSGNELMEHVLELRSLNTRMDVRHLRKRRERDRALLDFLVKLSAARVRLLIKGVGLADEEVEMLKRSMVAYEVSFGAGGPEGAERESADFYVKNGLISKLPDSLGAR
jgi:hypothetical protein